MIYPRIYRMFRKVFWNFNKFKAFGDQGDNPFMQAFLQNRLQKFFNIIGIKIAKVNNEFRF